MSFNFLKKHGGRRTIEATTSNPYSILPTEQLKEFLESYETMWKTGKRIGSGETLPPGELKSLGKQIELMRRELTTR